LISVCHTFTTCVVVYARYVAVVVHVAVYALPLHARSTGALRVVTYVDCVHVAVVRDFAAHRSLLLIPAF